MLSPNQFCLTPPCSHFQSKVPSPHIIFWFVNKPRRIKQKTFCMTVFERQQPTPIRIRIWKNVISLFSQQWNVEQFTMFDPQSAFEFWFANGGTGYPVYSFLVLFTLTQKCPLNLNQVLNNCLRSFIEGKIEGGDWIENKVNKGYPTTRRQPFTFPWWKFVMQFRQN